MHRDITTANKIALIFLELENESWQPVSLRDLEQRKQRKIKLVMRRDAEVPGSQSTSSPSAAQSHHKCDLLHDQKSMSGRQRLDFTLFTLINK